MGFGIDTSNGSTFETVHISNQRIWKIIRPFPISIVINHHNYSPPPVKYDIVMLSPTLYKNITLVNTTPPICFCDQIMVFSLNQIAIEYGLKRAY